MITRAAICVSALFLIAGIFEYFEPLSRSSDRQFTLDLKRSRFTAFDYPSKRDKTSAVILFASGDGGWGTLEDSIAVALQKRGLRVIGIDSATYANDDYDLKTLQSDFTALANEGEKPFSAHKPPLIIGGYSMGAAQAIAAGGGPNPPSGLIGLLLIDPLSRGRFGLRSADQFNVLPTGPGTYGVLDFAALFKNIRIVQWHATEDHIDSREWLKALTVPYREFDLSGVGHYYNSDREDFLRRLVPSIDWILNEKPNK